MKRPRFAAASACAIACAFVLDMRTARAGHETPCYIDGCQSQDGRFVITAELVVDPAAGTKGGPPKVNPFHGPFKWKFTWKDNKEGKSVSFEPQGLSAGSIYAQLYMAPDGETFALFNPLKFHTAGKSDMHGKPAIDKGMPGYETQENFSKRIVIYRKDGTILKELGVTDLLKPDEWPSVGCVFGRVEWLREYPGFKWKLAPRVQYAFCRVSPDYTVLEFHPVTGKGNKGGGRTVRVSLTDGRILGDDEKLPEEKTPVRPFLGPEIAPDQPDRTKNIDHYRPSSDPVRVEGKFPGAGAAAGAAAAPVEKPAGDAKPVKTAATAGSILKLVKDGYAKLDTPAWLPAEKCLLFTDLDGKKLFRLDGTDTIGVMRDEACRGKVGPDGRFYGVFGNRLATWRPGEEPHVIVDKAAGGREISLNDLAVSGKGFLYFTTLKDPDKGRLSVVDISKKTVTVAWDGESEPDLWNPNGVAVSPDGKFLYVGLSSYKDRKKAGVRRFPIRDDGSPDIAAGKGAMWSAVATPDGIAVDRDGNVYVISGAAVVVCTPDGKKAASIAIPKGSGTNVAFGGDDGLTIYVTTDKALYAGRVNGTAASKPR